MILGHWARAPLSQQSLRCTTRRINKFIKARQKMSSMLLMSMKKRLHCNSLQRPRLEIGWSSHVGPTIVMRYKDKSIGLVFCHRRKERCLKIFGHTSFLCARCTGILTGFFWFIVLYHFGLLIPPPIALILVTPLVIDGVSQYLNLRVSNNVMRLGTGIIFAPAFFSLLAGLL